jgi:Fe-S-cluster containining protein
MPTSGDSPHDRLLRDWRANAVRREDVHYRFLRSLKMRNADAVDALAHRIHAEVFTQIDCTCCANCCKTAAVSLDNDDIDRIAAHLGVERAAFITAYLQPYPVEGRYHMNAQPCPLLGADDRCTAYAVRPECCRSYPNTDRPGFATRTYQHAANATICPAVYHIVERMRRRQRRSS